MDKILAIVLNPALDVTMWVDRFDFAEPLTALRETVHPAGRAVNEARVFRALGVDCRLLGVAGNQNVGLFNSLLQQEGVDFVFLETEGFIRENIATVFPDGRMLKVNRKGFTVSGDLMAALTRRVQREVESARCPLVVFAGSLPPGVSAMRYRDLIAAAQEKGALIALDTAIFTAEQVRELHPFVMKPNLPELSKLAGRELRGMEEIIAFARTMLPDVVHILVSMGEDGLCYVGRELTLTVRVPTVEVRSTIGAGDTTLAAFLTALRRRLPLPDAVRFAAAAGTASVCLEGTAAITEERLLELLPQVYFD